jgi:pimeloyl-ACP methyl ester carboxylesterase
MRRRPYIALALAAAVAGCGGGSPARAPTSTPAPHVEALSSCGAVTGWKALPVKAHGDALDAATMGSGSTGVVFANQSGNDDCAWLPFAAKLARAGDRVAVFEYLDPGSADVEALAVDRALRADGASEVALIGASIGGRAVVKAAAEDRRDVAAAISLSAERTAGTLPELLPQARRVRVPSLYVGSENDGWTTFGRDTRQLHSATPARVNRMLMVPGVDHGTDLLSDENGPRVQAAIVAFLAATVGH